MLKPLRILYNFKFKKTHLDYLPVRLWIEPTNLCNLKCVMCPNKTLSKEDKGYLEFSLYKKIIDELKEHNHTCSIVMNHRGESLLHPKIYDMISYAHKNGHYIELHTNATLLNQEKSEKLIMSGLNLLSFSFDGYSKEVYESIRVGANFERTLKNINDFILLKQELGEKTPHTILEVIDFEDYSKDSIKRYEQLNADKIIIKEMHNWGGNLSPLKMNKKKPNVCTFPWYSLTIFWDGSVVLCPQDFYGNNTFGNIKNSTLEEIWNSEKIKDIREKMANREYKSIKPCNECDRIWRDHVFGIPRGYIKPFFKKNTPISKLKILSKP